MHEFPLIATLTAGFTAAWVFGLLTQWLRLTPIVGYLLAGRPDVAATIHGAAQAAFDRLGVRSPASYQDLAGFDPLPQLRDALGADGFETAMQDGKRLSLEEAVDLIEANLTA